jgi:hypothetical protein
MLLLWLNEKIARHEMAPAQADQMVHNLDRNIDWLTARIARDGDQVAGRLSQPW